jgi:hypothetical protein
VRFLDPKQEWDETDPFVIRMRYMEALSEGQEQRHQEEMRRFREQGQRVEEAWARQGKRWFLRRWWDEFTGAALQERQLASLGVVKK